MFLHQFFMFIYLYAMRHAMRSKLQTRSSIVLRLRQLPTSQKYCKLMTTLTMYVRLLLFCALIFLQWLILGSLGFATHPGFVFLRVPFVKQNSINKKQARIITHTSTSSSSSSWSSSSSSFGILFLSTNFNEGNVTKKNSINTSPSPVVVAETVLKQKEEEIIDYYSIAVEGAEQREESPSSPPPSKTSQNYSSYRFGDITRSLLKRTTAQVTVLTGKQQYEFGDLSRWLDQQAKGKINEITGRDGEYVLGDLTRWADHQAKEIISNYTGKEDYQVGDISKEVVRRTMSGEYELQDVILALRVLLSAGISLSPIAAALPVKVVMELINLGLAQEVGGKVMDVLGKSLDERFKLALTGDSQYRLGDISKRELMKSLSAFTGKSEYAFGDISKRVAELAAKENKTKIDELKMDEHVRKDLAWWDKRFQEQSGLK